MKEIRKLAETYPEVEQEIKDSVKSSKELLESVLRLLKLKDVYFHTVNALPGDKLIKFATVLKCIDDTCDPTILLDKPMKIGKILQGFIKSHC